MKNTKPVQKTVRVRDIPAIVEDPTRGVVSLLGDHGGLSLITGPFTRSGLVMGTLSVETEHGVVYLDPDELQEISEELPLSEDHPWKVSWTIDSTGPSPEEAAAGIWRDIFGRNFAGRCWHDYLQLDQCRVFPTAQSAKRSRDSSGICRRPDGYPAC